jgi:nicotinamidase/pyrazinamidase
MVDERSGTMGEKALLIIDFQNDFVPGGALPVPEGDKIAPRVNELVNSGEFEPIVATRDWHPPDHNSFEEQGGPWPPHCVRQTEGAELYQGFDHSKVDHFVNVGSRPEHEGYSGFEHSDLEDVLRRHGVEEVTVVGLATDYCVRASALDALELGLKTTVDPEGVRGIDVEPGDSERALDEIRAAGGEVKSIPVGSRS